MAKHTSASRAWPWPGSSKAGLTMLDAAGLPIPGAFQGTSLLSAVLGDQDSLPASGSPLIAYRDTAVKIPEQAIRHGKWKLIDDRLYDLEQDPGELLDVASEHPEVVARLAETYRQAISAKTSLDAPTAHISESTRAQLDALGYTN